MATHKRLRTSYCSPRLCRVNGAKQRIHILHNLRRHMDTSLALPTTKSHLKNQSSNYSCKQFLWRFGAFVGFIKPRLHCGENEGVSYAASHTREENSKLCGYGTN